VNGKGKMLFEFLLSWVIIHVAGVLFTFGILTLAIISPLIGILMIAAVPLLLFLWFRR
jgi:hypothetical protein